MNQLQFEELPSQLLPKFTLTSNHQKEQYELILNNKYTLKSDSEFYPCIQVLFQFLQQKNRKSKCPIKQRFNLNYFSSLQFHLSNANMNDEVCTICLDNFQKKSISQIQKQLSQQLDQDIYVLPCSHKYHIYCLTKLIGQNTWVKCPVCSTIFGQMTGDQPKGTMVVKESPLLKLPGYEKWGTITIHYVMQGDRRNGVKFAGTSRTAYLPDSPEGKQVLKLLEEAFHRKLVFTVGRSVTSGLDNQTVWNGIHHKTSMSGGSANFGYPDPTYLKRVKEELAAKGITSESIKKPPIKK